MRKIIGSKPSGIKFKISVIDVQNIDLIRED